MNKLTILLIAVALTEIADGGAGMLEPLATLYGPSNYGKAVISGVDINGGGVPDIVVGSYFDGPGYEGMVYVYFGESFDTIPDLRFKGETSFSFFGEAVSFCPDLNGNGSPELVVGARLYNGGVGKIYVYFGGSGIDTTADLTLVCPTGGIEQFGFAVACGNLTGTASPEIAVGAPYYFDGSNYTGRIYLFTDVNAAGPADTLIFAGASGTGSDEFFGSAVAIGRMDGNIDTWDDLLAGAPSAYFSAGEASLFYGSPAMDVNPDLVWQGGPGELLGTSVASIADVNHDGLQDLAIGIPQRNSSRGACYIVLGKTPQDTTPDYVLNGDLDGGNFGISISAVGDVNDDGYSDLTVGAKNYNGGVGRIFLYATEFDTVYEAYADAPDPYNSFGVSVAGCGDLNGDGFGDIIIGSDGSTGRAYIYRGRDEFVPPVIDSVTALNDTGYLGPFVVSAYIYDSTGISCDSLYCNVNGAGYIPLAQDSVSGNTFFFHIPEQPPPAYVSTTVEWYLMARDNSFPCINVTYSPPRGAAAPYSFQIFDQAGPAITNTTVWPDTSFLGPYQIYCNVADASGISLVRLCYWESSGQQHVLPMYPTGAPGQYYASIPVQNYGRVIAYRVEARDSFAIPNMGYDPEDYPTGYAFIIGSVNPALLLVDNDDGDTMEVYYKKTLDSLQVSYFRWPDSWGSPRNLMGDNFPVVIWFTAQKTSNILVAEDRDSLAAFFLRGGKLFISSQNLGEDIGSTSFYQDYLHAQFDAGTITEMRAIAMPGDSVGDIYKDTISIGGIGGANNADSKDRIFALAGADSVYRYRQIGGSAAIKYKDTATGYRVVYFAFPWEAIDGTPVLFAQRGPVMASVLRWLGVIPGVSENNPGVPALVFALNQIKPNPFSIRTRIRYSTPAKDHVSLKIYDQSGRLVRDLYSGKIEPGTYSCTWEGNDNAGRQVPSGVYFIIYENPQARLNQKIVLMH
jgi:hypothetical protein